jgi:lysozyme
MRVPEVHLRAAASLIAGMESCAAKTRGGMYVPYPDPAWGWAKPTVGYGVVCGAGAGPYTHAECVGMLFGMLAGPAYGGGVLGVLPWLAEPRHLWRFAACGSFVWNLGLPNFKASGMRKHLEQGNWAAAGANCRFWCNANGKPLKHLVWRRGVEAGMLQRDAQTEA